MQKNHASSLLMMALAMMIFGSIGIFRRYIPLSSAALACFRGVSGALLLLLAAKVQKKKIRHQIGTKKVLLLVLTGGMMGLNWLLLFEAYTYTSVATATLCYYMQPAIVILLSPLVFRERISLKKGLCVLLSVIGMILVSGLAEGAAPAGSEWKGIACGLGAAVLYASVVVMNKKLPGIDPYEKTVLQLLSAAAVLVPYLLLIRQSCGAGWTPTAFFLLLIVGFVHTGVAYALYFGSMDGLRVQTVAIFSYLDPIAALLLSACFLHERLSVSGLAGAALILGAALFSEIDVKQVFPARGRT